jgi:hypothetical protein
MTKVLNQYRLIPIPPNTTELLPGWSTLTLPDPLDWLPGNSDPTTIAAVRAVREFPEIAESFNLYKFLLRIDSVSYGWLSYTESASEDADEYAHQFGTLVAYAKINATDSRVTG